MPVGATQAANWYFRRISGARQAAAVGLHNTLYPAGSAISGRVRRIASMMTDLWLGQGGVIVNAQDAIANANAAILLFSPPTDDALLSDLFAKVVTMRGCVDGGAGNPDAIAAGQVAAFRAAVAGAAAPAYGGDSANDSLAELLQWVAVTHGLA